MHRIPTAYIRKWQRTVDLLAELFDGAYVCLASVRDGVVEPQLTAPQTSAVNVAEWVQGTCLGSLAAQVAHQISVLSIDCIPAIPDWPHPYVPGSDPVSFLGVPLLWPEDVVLGSLCIGTLERRAFSTIDEKLIWQIKELIEGDLRIIHFSREVEKRKTSLEQKIIGQNAQLQLLLDSTAEAIFGINLRGCCTFCNRACLNMLGYDTQESLLGCVMYERVWHVDETSGNTQYLCASFLQAVQHGESCHEDCATFVRSDGTHFPVEYWVYPQQVEGRVTGAVVTFLDISERRRAEAELRRVTERLQLATHAAHIGIWDWSIQSNELIWDDAMYTLYGIDRMTFNGAYEAWTRCLDPRDSQRAMQAVQKALTRAGEFSTEFRIIWPDGSVRHIAAQAQTYFDKQGQALRMIGANFDITDLKQAEAEISQLNVALETRVAERTRELEEMVQQLETFSYTVSHDLRAPLRAIDGFSNILLEDYSGQLDETAQGHLNRVRLGVNLMGRLIDDLLDLAKIGKRTVRRSVIDLSALATQVGSELAMGEPNRLVEFIVGEIGSALCDEGLTRIIVQNLLQNAWKYSRTQSAARVEIDRCDRNGRTVYFVRDNGIGFDMAHANHLFRPFTRLHNTQDYEGSGIGLATVHQAITRHGGEIWAESQPGRGATFYFTLGG